MTTEGEWKELLAGLTVEELSGLYLSREDFDMQGACYSLLQRRPAGPLIKHGRTLAGSVADDERRFATDLLGLGIRRRRRGWESALALLVRLMDDPSPDVVSAAAMAYGALHISWSNDQGPRARAQRDDPSLIPWPEPLPTTLDPSPLCRLADHSDMEVRRSLPTALFLWADPISVGVLLRLSADENSDVRASAARQLGWLSWAGGCTPEVIQRLWELASDPDDWIRNSALAALLKLRQSAADAAVVAELEWNCLSRSTHPILLELTHRRDFLPQRLLAKVAGPWRISAFMNVQEWITAGLPDSDATATLAASGPSPCA